jgi:hypothetical protein
MKPLERSVNNSTNVKKFQYEVENHDDKLRKKIPKYLYKSLEEKHSEYKRRDV